MQFNKPSHLWRKANIYWLDWRGFVRGINELAAIQMNRIRKRFRIFAGTKLKDKNVKYNFFQTIKDGNPQSGLPISLIFKERNYAYFTEYFIHTPQQRFTV